MTSCPLSRQRYEQSINRLIPEAEQAALDRVKALGKTFELRPAVRSGGKETYHHDFFSEFFHEEMNRLAYAHGYRGKL